VLDELVADHTAVAARPLITIARNAVTMAAAIRARRPASCCNRRNRLNVTLPRSSLSMVRARP